MANCESRTGFSFNNPDLDADYFAPSWGLLVTADELRYDELFGNQLIAEADSQSITDEQLLDYIRLAIGYMEQELHIDILPRRVRYYNLLDGAGNEIERNIPEDVEYLASMNPKQKALLYKRENGYAYKLIPAKHSLFIRLRRRPLRRVLSAVLVDDYYGREIINLYPYRVEKKGLSSTLHFRPKMIGGGSFRYSYLWQPRIFNQYFKNIPDVFKIDYETGYENCADVPDDIRNIVKKIAACTLMNIYGDGKLAAVASRSVNLNSVSESINTTLSATSATFGARIIQYQKEIREWFAVNRSSYSRTNIGSLS
jgi:hypothetical protein